MDFIKSKELYIELEEKVTQAEANGDPIEELVKEQIELLWQLYEYFVKTSLEQNPKIENSMSYQEIKITQLLAIVELCKKIGIDSDKYETMIKEIRLQLLGEEMYAKFFGDK